MNNPDIDTTVEATDDLPITAHRYWCEPATWGDERVLTRQVQLAVEYGRELARIENLSRALLRSHARGALACAAESRALSADHARRAAARAAVDDRRPDESVTELAARAGVSAELAQSMRDHADVVVAQATAVKAARGRSVDLGLYWGSYQQADEAHSDSCRTTPGLDDVRVWRGGTGEGCFAVHLQPARALRGGADAWVRYGDVVRHQSPYRRDHRDDGGVDRSGRPRPAKHREVLLRAGTVPGGRAPVFVRIHVLEHRPLPPGAVVSWVRVHRRVVGTRVRWEYIVVARAGAAADLKSRDDIRQHDLSSAEQVPGHEVSGQGDSTISARESRSRDELGALSPAEHHAERAARVGVDVGWRRVGDRVRVAYWWGSDGRHGEIALPDRTLRADEKSDSLRAIRDRNFLEIRARVRAWVGDVSDDRCWIVEACRGIHGWLRKVRLIKLLARWRAERVVGDGEIFGAVEAWAKQDRHLWDWEAAGREGRRRRVQETLRVAAVHLAREYESVGVRDAAVAKMVRRPSREYAAACPECRAAGRRCPACWDAERLRRIAATRVPHACPALLIRELERAGRAYRAEVARLDRSVEARQCTACGDPRAAVADWAPLVVACPACGVAEDQDVTASRNLCRMTATAREDGAVRTPKTKKMGARRTRKAAVAGTTQ